MKKVLLSALAVAAGLVSYGQGITSTAAYDDFKKASEFSDKYSTETEETLLENGECVEDEVAYMGIFTYDDKGEDDNNGFFFQQTRNMEEGKLELDYFQDYGDYTPFGFVFGTYCDGTQTENEGTFTLDLTANSVVSFDVELTSLSEDSADALMKIQLQDLSGNVISLSGGVEDEKDASYKYELGITGESPKSSDNGTGETSFNVADGLISFSYDFAEGWTSDIEGNATTEKTFDYSKVKGLTLTFVSNNKEATDGFKSYPLDIIVEVSNLMIGSDAVLSSKDFSTNANNVALYPNPATTEVNFTEVLNNVSVYNMNGAVVETLSSATSLNVASYEAGVYFINADNFSGKVVVE